MSNETINTLRFWADTYNTIGFVERDPVQFPRRYTGVSAEISGFITAWISFGNRKAIVEKAEYLNSCLLGRCPYLFIYNRVFKSFELMDAKIYRMLSYRDFYELCDRLYYLYKDFNGMEDMIIKSGKAPLQAICDYFQGIKGIPDYSKGSACKRLCMFMRWMVRNDGIVDLGLWKQISPRDLIIPLDTHVHRVALDLGITRRKQPDMRTAKEVTEFFAGIYPDDPALGDFALFGYGIH